MQLKKKQQGVTAIGWVIILMLIGFIALIVLKLTPIYAEYFSVKTSLDSLAQESLAGKSRQEIRKMLTKRFDINDVRRVEHGDIEISESRGTVTVRVAYEAREKFVGNVYLVVEFDESIEAN